MQNFRFFKNDFKEIVIHKESNKVSIHITISKENHKKHNSYKPLMIFSKYLTKLAINETLLPLIS